MGIKMKKCNKLTISRETDTAVIEGNGFQIDITKEYKQLLYILDTTPEMEISQAPGFVSELFNYKGHTINVYEDDEHAKNEVIFYLKDNQTGINNSVQVLKDNLKALQVIRDESVTGQIINGLKTGEKPN